MINHKFEDSGNGLCKVITGNTMCNSPSHHAVHDMQNLPDETVKIENPSNQVRTMPIDIMPPGSREVDPRKL